MVRFGLSVSKEGFFSLSFYSIFPRPRNSSWEIAGNEESPRGFGEIPERKEKSLLPQKERIHAAGETREKVDLAGEIGEFGIVGRSNNNDTYLGSLQSRIPFVMYV